jgi:Dyp-type peroxidase family
MPDPKPDPDNIQANILHGSSRWGHAGYLFYRIDNVQSTRDFITALMASGLVHTAGKRPGAPPRNSNINIAFTYRGLESMKLGIADSERFRRDHVMRRYGISKLPSDAVLGSNAYDDPDEPTPDEPTPDEPVPDGSPKPHGPQDDRLVTAFEGGMRVAKIGDVWPTEVPEVQGEFQWSDGTPAKAWWSDESAPQAWEDNRDLWPHLLVWISAKGDREREDVVKLVRELASQNKGPTEIGYQVAASLRDNKEHFGFVDGISQPAIEGIRPGKPGDGKLGARGWQGLKVGEFILGYPDEGYSPQTSGSSENAMRDGTFLVYRKIAQNVAAFKDTVKTMAEASGVSDDDIAAKLMGRKQNGEPLVVTPGAPDPPAMNLRNDFTYANDQDGLRCPFGSHVRRSNPRDDLHFEGRRVNRHRIIRRGMPYGPAYLDDPQADRGLIFIAFNARIEDQFEFIQREWLNTGRPFRTGDDAEPVAGLGTNMRVVINGEQPVFHKQARPFTEFRGGDYFFVPSMSTLESIASGSFATQRQEDELNTKGRNGIQRPRTR